MGRVFSLVLVVVGLGVAVVAAVFALSAMYVIGRYDGCFYSSGSGGSNACHINGLFGITAGGTAGDSGAVAAVVVTAILVVAGVVLALGGVHRLGVHRKLAARPAAAPAAGSVASAGPQPPAPPGD